MVMFQIAFAGHNRANDLGHHQPVIEGLDAAFALLKAAGVGQARLLSGLAPGADELAVAAWRRAGIGPVHAVYPFLHEGADGPLTADSATWLNGSETEALGRNPHLKQTRLVVETADLLVVVWTGERARGSGGTADAVRYALELGLAVLWIKPSDSPALRLIRPEQLPADFDFHEFQEGLVAGVPAHVEDATAEALAAILGLTAADIAAAAEEPEPALAPWEAAMDEWLHSWLWKTYGTFRKLVGGSVGYLAPGPDVPEDLRLQPGFNLLTEAYERADRHANRLAAVHRSEQIILVLVMVLAAVVGSSPAIWHGFKLWGVALEILLGLFALLVWYSASRTRQHERWGKERQLAEQIRLERAGWALGVSLLSTRRRSLEPERLDFAGGLLRDAGLPEGRFTSDREQAWGAWALHELIDSQAAYHRATSHRDHRIEHRLHLLENTAFVLLLVALSSYLTVELALKSLESHLPKWGAGLITMASTIVPAVAAGIMALEAKLEFREQSDRSKRISERLDLIRSHLGDRPTFDDMQSAARAAIRLHLAEATQWSEGVGRRRLFRP